MQQKEGEVAGYVVKYPDLARRGVNLVLNRGCLDCVCMRALLYEIFKQVVLYSRVSFAMLI